ncbi:MAG: hypothetical protein JWN86_4036 [Planctomycetota bacterium]|nr:hypothetical protein [Planctomycetota bacterium]
MNRIIATVLLLLPVVSRGDQAQSFPPPAPASDPKTLGVGVQRTLTLLATSTPEKRNKVRILFYGQSITEQDWSKQVADDLRRRFPNADLEIENRAIGGFASQLLIKSAEQDLYPFYPDLLIFHVYGGNQEYDEIIKNARSRATAEVLMQKDHVTQWPPEKADPSVDKGMWWDHMMNHVFLPEIAKKYGCTLLDVRGPWLDYLRTNKLEPKALLKDGVHLNDHGNFLMAELVKRHLVHRPDLPAGGDKDAVLTRELGAVVQADTALKIPFDGNRIDMIAGQAGSGSISVLIDGKRPSEIVPDLFRATRPSPGPWSPLTVIKVGKLAHRVAEDWTIKITSVTPDSKDWTYDLTGSLTGPDGSGRGSQTLVSNSSRVRIGADSWFRNGAVPVGHEIRWKVVPMFADRYETPKTLDPSREAVTTLAQGLPNGPHLLELHHLSGAPVSVRAVRIYRPAVGREAGVSR